MARLFTNGFEINSVTNGVDWTTHSGTPTNQTSVVRSGSRAGQINGLGSGAAKGWGHQFVATATGGPYYARAYFQYTTLPSVTCVIMALSNAITFPGLNSGDSCIKITTGGNLQLFIGGSQVGSNSAALSSGTWYMLELYVDGTPASGSRICRARIDGVEFAGTATATTFNNPRTLFVGGNVFFEASTTGVFYWDDIAVNDSTGSYQNSYPGSGKVITLFPDAAGDSNAWLDTSAAAGSTNNYQLVDENPPNDATDLVQSVTANAQDLYNFGASGIGASDTVNVVEVYSRHRNNTADATTSFALVIEKAAAGTKTQGSTVLPNTTTWRTGLGNGTAEAVWPSLVAHRDPDGAAWTSTTVDSLQAGPKLVAAGTNRVQVSAVWVTVDYTPTTTQTKNLSDTAAGTDALSVQAQTFPTDSATSVESVTVNAQIPTLADAAVGGDNLSVRIDLNLLNLSDSAAGTDFLSVLKVNETYNVQKIALFKDSFPGSQLDAARWYNPDGNAEVEANQVALPCTSEYSSVESTQYWDATESAIFIKATPPTLHEAREYALKLNLPGEYDYNGVWMGISGTNPGALFVIVRRNGVKTKEAYYNFDTTSMAYWRIRETGGLVYWETSPNGVNWSYLDSYVHGLDLREVTVIVTCGFYDLPTGGLGYGDGTYGGDIFGGASDSGEAPATASGYLSYVNTLTLLPATPTTPGSPGTGYGHGPYGHGPYGHGTTPPIVVPPTTPPVSPGVPGNLNGLKAPDPIELKIMVGPYKTGIAHAIANPQGVSFNFRVEGPSELRFEVTDKTDASYIKARQTDIWVWRGQLAWQRFRVVSCDRRKENDGEYSWAITAVDYRGWLDMREVVNTILYPNMEQVDIVWDVITKIQTLPGGDLRITKGVWPNTGILRDEIEVRAGDTAFTTIANLGILPQGFEFDIEPDNEGKLKANIYHPQRGVDQGVVLDVDGLISTYSVQEATSDYGNSIHVVGEDDVEYTAEAPDILTRPEGRIDRTISDSSLRGLAMVQAKAEYLLAQNLAGAGSYSMRFSPGAWDQKGGPGFVWLGDRVRVLIKDDAVSEDFVARVMEIVITYDSSMYETVDVVVGRELYFAERIMRNLLVGR